MRRWLVATTAAVVLLTLAAPAGAGDTTEIEEGDGVFVRGTSVLCVALTTDNVLGMGCLKASTERDPRPGSFTVGLARNGRVHVNRIKANGKGELVFRRKLQGSGRRYTAEVGDAFGLAGTDIRCNVARIGAELPKLFRGIRILCYLVDGDEFRPSTYGISISNRFAAVFRIDEDGEGGSNVFVRRHRD